MRCLALLVFSLSLSAPAMAEPDFSQLSRADALERYEEVSVAMTEASMLMYTRVDPSLDEVLGDPEWDEVDREAAECVYDTYKESGDLELLEDVISATEDLTDLIREDESIDMLAVIKGDISETLLKPDLAPADEERNMEVTLECDVIEANQRRLNMSELMPRLMALAEAS